MSPRIQRHAPSATIGAPLKGVNPGVHRADNLLVIGGRVPMTRTLLLPLHSYAKEPGRARARAVR